MSVCTRTLRFYSSRRAKFATTSNKPFNASEQFQKDKDSLLPLYARPDIVFQRGKGCFLFDLNGTSYLDFTSGIAVNALGHSHPAVVKAIQQQSQNVIHLSNLYHNVHAGSVASKLTSALSNPTEWKVFLCNSGTEANEAAIKFSRCYGHRTASSDKHIIVSFTNAFHGRSLGALSATPTRNYQDPFKPLLPGFVYADYNDPSSLSKVMNKNVCAVILEPVQGEGGVSVANPEFLRHVRALCDKFGALLIMDEIQSGIGRTGKMFAHQWLEVHPDIISVAKPLANGLPVGATIVSNKVAEHIKPGDHGTTFGGNPFVTSVASTVLDIINRPKFLDTVISNGEYFKEQMTKNTKGSNLVKEVRGKGLMLGVQFHDLATSKCFIERCRDKKLLLVGAGLNTVRLLPPLIVKREEIDQAVEIMTKSIQEL